MSFKFPRRFLLMSGIAAFLAGCASSMPAPVVNKSPQDNNQAPPPAADTPATTNTSQKASGDWRPDTYTVKKGDTLYSIGLNHGLDYREIAAANNIYQPYTIKIGQRLNLTSLKANDPVSGEKPAAYENEDGVIISPIDIEAPITKETNVSVVTPVLTQPKAVREPYSIEALNRKPEVNQPSNSAKTPQPTEEQATKAVVAAKRSKWSWPTQGKVTAKFNGSKNKGIDIAGKKGQPITASANGKVIYAGSDLRGYGKLVIVKHSNTYLSVYAHNSKITVKEGQSVQSGQKIAEMGDTDTNAIKLHFEIRERGKSVDPEKFLPQT